MKKEAANRIGFGETVAVEGPGSDAQKSASEIEFSLLSNYPKTPARPSGDDRITPETKALWGVLIVTSAAQTGVHCRHSLPRDYR